MPLQNLNSGGALHGKTYDFISPYNPSPVVPVAGVQGTGSGTSYVTNRTTNYRAERLNQAVPLGALHYTNLNEQPRGSYTYKYRSGFEVTKDYMLEFSTNRLSALDDDPVKNSVTHALHSPYILGNTRYDDVIQISSKSGAEIKLSNVLAPTKLRLDALAENPILNSHTHALHSPYIAGNTRYDDVKQISSKSGVEITLGNVLAPTKMRLDALKENPILNSHTHALYSPYTGGNLRYDDVLQISSKSGVETRLKNVLAPTKTRLERLAANPILNSHTHALHSANKSGQVRGQASQTGFRGQAPITYSNLLSPTVRRLQGLAENPVLKSFTHALHSAPGAGGNIWAKTGKFATFHTQAKDGMPSGPKSGEGKMSVGGLISGLADTMKTMLFGGPTWPIGRFHFYVMIGGTELGFQAVEGLEAEIGVIEYRDGNAPFFGKDKMPGMVNYSRVTMRKGMFVGDTKANKWFKEIAQDRLYTKRRTIIIAMMDNNIIPHFIWRYEQAFLTKVTPSNLDAESENEVAIEEMEFVGRAWYLETLAGAAAGAAGALAGAAGVNLNF